MERIFMNHILSLKIKKIIYMGTGTASQIGHAIVLSKLVSSPESGFPPIGFTRLCHLFPRKSLLFHEQ